ncbi:MAG: SGNH/GDSL hydrolase family protein [Polyangiaceae bacterium]|nr:SGNH/GDSL hydrolase family protein [Myxococcales bacterium]MCB9586160.1 SGNH/GDSL hydrolase family protein [Polyangiaceae bacterium]MCB9606837.1 SGNH/GDSL hydrolase family protein [Polyangiaceae bacterium]
MRAALVGLPKDVYASERNQMFEGAKHVARTLLNDSSVTPLLDRLPLKEGSQVVVFGDSHTSDPESWATILTELLASRGVSLTINAAPGDTTTHGLIRIGQVIAQQPEWVLFLLGTNDARTQGPNPTKTLVDASESARNIIELQRRTTRETQARCLWLTPPAVNEERVANHWGLSRFGVGFRNEDVARIATSVRELDAPTIDLFSLLGTPPAAELLMDDGLHLSLAGQKRVALEALRGWSQLA